jgi:hypothetical protein
MTMEVAEIHTSSRDPFGTGNSNSESGLEDENFNANHLENSEAQTEIDDEKPDNPPELLYSQAGELKQCYKFPSIVLKSLFVTSAVLKLIEKQTDMYNKQFLSSNLLIPKSKSGKWKPNFHSRSKGIYCTYFEHGVISKASSE